MSYSFAQPHVARAEPRSRRLFATVVLVLTVAFGAFAVPNSANAAPNSGELITCGSTGSGDVCWWNYNTAYDIYRVATDTQYTRDQVCGKAREGSISGPVSAGSDCIGGASYIEIYFPNSGSRKAYGYWAGNGGNIWTRVRGNYLP